MAKALAARKYLRALYYALAFCRLASETICSGDRSAVVFFAVMASNLWNVLDSWSERLKASECLLSAWMALYLAPLSIPLGVIP